MIDGYAIFLDVLIPAEIKVFLCELESQNFVRSRAGARHLMSVPAVAALARDPRLLRLAERALGSNPIPFRATLFDKSQDSTWLVTWHQDTTLPLVERCEVGGWGPWSVKGNISYAHAPAAALEKVVALRIHLDDSTRANGPLRLIPGTHRLGLLTDVQMHEMAQTIQPVACVAPRGSVVAMRPLTVHASSKATAALRRRVIHIEYSSEENFGNGLVLRAA